MKINENQVIILGCHKSKDNIKTAHAIGTQRFKIFKLELNNDANLKVHEKIFLDDAQIKKIITTMSYHDLSNAEKGEVEKAVRSIIISNQSRFLDFFNAQNKDASQLHLLGDISRKSSLKILDKKEKDGDFTSFKDIEKRISQIKDVEDLITQRVLYEIIELPQSNKGRPVYLFVNAKRANIKKEFKLSKFEDDDSFFIEKLKKQGMIESSGKKLKW
ncbi:MAG: DUF655 domain-containing protein [Methanobacteriaceae archaeon]|nr:DUF655 domain-containing protein [Methanobacteriaceae archaeon]